MISEYQKSIGGIFRCTTHLRITDRDHQEGIIQVLIFQNYQSRRDLRNQSAFFFVKFPFLEAFVYRVYLHIPRFIIHFPRCLDPCFFGWFFPGASPQVETWGLLATAWARQGETEKAAKWLRQAAKCEGVRFLVDVGTLLWCLCWGVPVCWQEFFFSKAFISSIFMFSLCQAELMHTHTNVGRCCI